MLCPHCGQEHAASTIFCPVTGQKLEVALFCTNCGAQIQQSYKVCPRCGAVVSEVTQTDSVTGKQIAKSRQPKVLIPLWITILFSTLILAIAIYLIFPNPGTLPDKSSAKVSIEISASTGGEVSLPNRTVVRIPPNSLQTDTQVSIQESTAESAPAMQEELMSVGDAYLIDLGTDALEKTVMLEIPFDPASLPNDVEPGQVFLSYYDESEQEWVYAGGKVDTSRNVIVLETIHASWWMPTTWNWKAWIAVLNKTLQVGIVNWIEAAKLLTDDCPQTGNYVQVDSSRARNLVQGCVERDDAEHPALRIINPKSFFFEVRPISGGNGYPVQTVLSPGEDLKFEASVFDPAPLIIEANMTQKSGWYLVVHMVLTMLPGANQFGIQGKQVACVTERLADVHYFTDAVEALLAEQNGSAAAESLSGFMLDGDAVRRFITAADDCNFGPAPTWSVEGVRQIGGAVSTIMSATDYVANYFAGNTQSQVSFLWETTNVPADKPVVNGAFKMALFLKDGTLKLLDINGNILAEMQTGIRADSIKQASWSPNGEYLLISIILAGQNYVYLIDTIKNETYPWPQPIGADFLYNWSPDSKHLSLDTGSGPGWQLDIVSIDGSLFKTVYQGWIVNNTPRWSPNSKYLAVAGSPSQSSPLHLYLINADTGEIQDIMPAGFESAGFSDNWLQDGKLVFAGIDQGNMTLQVLDPATSITEPLLKNPPNGGIVGWPKISPSGIFIAYAAKQIDGSWSLYVENLQTNEREQIWRVDEAVGVYPVSWSPDESRFVFTHQTDRAGQNNQAYIADLSTRQIQPLPGLIPWWLLQSPDIYSVSNGWIDDEHLIISEPINEIGYEALIIDVDGNELHKICTIERPVDAICALWLP